MEHSVESLCNQLARSRLLEADAVRAMRQRWRSEAKEADDAEKFSKWIVANKFVTEFQLGLVTRGFTDLLFFGEYKLLDRIGQGRMAGVYRAVHKLGQQVAIKVLPPSKANHPQLLARFQREARLAQRLKHANVVRAFQQGQTKGGLNYLVMEYLDGETFEDVLERRGKLPVAEAVHVVSQALQGLQHLFEEGMIHRDLKPANLMLVPGRAPGQPDTTLRSTVKILDIGLGKALFDEGAAGFGDNTELTTEGSLLGTPNYMAPEQARSAQQADIRADIYSLGCVLYHAVGGEPPFSDTNFLRQMVRHATEPARPLKQLNPVVPDALQGVVDTLLAKDPAQRFPTPAQALKALKGFLVAEAAAPKPLESEPEMSSYLSWLEEQKPAPAEAPDAPPSPAAPVAAPRAAAAALAVPVARSMGSPAAQTIPAGVPLARPITAPSVSAAASVKEAAIPMAVAIGSPTPQESDAPTVVGAKRLGLFKRLEELGVTRRDYLAAGAGAGLLLVLEGLLWLIVRLFS